MAINSHNIHISPLGMTILAYNYSLHGYNPNTVIPFSYIVLYVNYLLFYIATDIKFDKITKIAYPLYTVCSRKTANELFICLSFDQRQSTRKNHCIMKIISFIKQITQ